MDLSYNSRKKIDERGRLESIILNNEFVDPKNKINNEDEGEDIDEDVDKDKLCK